MKDDFEDRYVGGALWNARKDSIVAMAEKFKVIYGEKEQDGDYHISYKEPAFDVMAMMAAHCENAKYGDNFSRLTQMVFNVMVMDKEMGLEADDFHMFEDFVEYSWIQFLAKRPKSDADLTEDGKGEEFTPVG